MDIAAGPEATNLGRRVDDRFPTDSQFDQLAEKRKELRYERACEALLFYAKNLFHRVGIERLSTQQFSTGGVDHQMIAMMEAEYIQFVPMACERWIVSFEVQAPQRFSSLTGS